MTEHEIWKSVRYSPDKVAAVYARSYSNGEVKIFEVDAKGKTVREYWMACDQMSAADLAKMDVVQDRYYEQVRIR